MPTDLEISGFNLIGVVLLGIGLFSLLHFIRRLARRLPVSPARHKQIDRAFPVVEALVGLLYALSAVPVVFHGHPQYSPLAVAIVLLGFGWVSWFAIRDFVSGAFLKAGRHIEVGDEVQIGELRGRLIRLGYRTLSIETPSGPEAVIPFGQMGKEPLIRTPRADGAHRYVFTLAAPAHHTAPAARQLILRAVLTHHWASIVRAPRIQRLADGRFEVVVYALAPDRGPEIERAVCDQVLSPTDGSCPPRDSSPARIAAPLPPGSAPRTSSKIASP